MKLPRLNVDRWDAITLAGAAFLGAGVWGLVGPWWACVTWGVLLLGVANLHAALGALAARPRRKEGA